MNEDILTLFNLTCHKLRPSSFIFRICEFCKMPLSYIPQLWLYYNFLYSRLAFKYQCTINHCIPPITNLVPIREAVVVDDLVCLSTTFWIFPSRIGQRRGNWIHSYSNYCQWGDYSTWQLYVSVCKIEFINYRSSYEISKAMYWSIAGNSYCGNREQCDDRQTACTELLNRQL